jgi:hypothetical protein
MLSLVIRTPRPEQPPKARGNHASSGCGSRRWRNRGFYLALIPASFTTRPHFSRSATM